jgi:tetratricopeptide (TPR) repeat protein
MSRYEARPSSSLDGGAVPNASRTFRCRKLYIGLSAFVFAVATSAGGNPVFAEAQSAAVSAPAQSAHPVPAYYDIQPGISTRAQVELRYGEPLRRTTPDALIYEYAPPTEDADSDRVVITFDPDTQKVVRLDAYLKTFLPASALREKFGARIAVRDRPDGGREEFYYPQLQALIFGETTPDAPVVAISFMSPRTLAMVFMRRFEEAMERKAYEEARTEADKAVAVDPAGGAGYNLQGRLFTALGDGDEALVRLTAAANSAQVQRDRYVAHLLMAGVYTSSIKDLDKARAAHISAIETAPLSDRSEARLKYAKFLKEQGKDEDALVELRKAADAGAMSNPDARRQLAETYWEQGEFAVALPQYEALSRMADQTPENAGNGAVYYRYGATLRRAGKSSEAISAFEKAHKADPKQVAPLTELAALYLEQSKPTLAIDAYHEALSLDNDDVVVNRGLIYALYDAGKIEDARRQAELTLNLKPDDALTMFALARCFGALKDKKAALLWVQRAMDAGYSDHHALTSDPALALIREERAFKRLLAPPEQS